MDFTFHSKEDVMADLFELVSNFASAVYQDRGQESLAAQQRRQTIEIPQARLAVVEALTDNLSEMEIEALFDLLVEMRLDSLREADDDQG